jgi:hypothetical protein
MKNGKSRICTLAKLCIAFVSFTDMCMGGGGTKQIKIAKGIIKKVEY